MSPNTHAQGCRKNDFGFFKRRSVLLQNEQKKMKKNSAPLSSLNSQTKANHASSADSVGWSSPRAPALVVIPASVRARRSPRGGPGAGSGGGGRTRRSSRRRRFLLLLLPTSSKASSSVPGANCASGNSPWSLPVAIRSRQRTVASPATRRGACGPAGRRRRRKRPRPAARQTRRRRRRRRSPPPLCRGFSASPGEVFRAQDELDRLCFSFFVF